MPKKTLEQAIGCWTTSPDGIPRLMSLVQNSTRFCKTRTKENDPDDLLHELRILRKRLGTMVELTDAAMERCRAIIDTKELEQDVTDEV